MKCPHCLVEFHDELTHNSVVSDVEGTWIASSCKCPACKKSIIYLGLHNGKMITMQTLARPKSISRALIPREVPKKYATDYQEACLILSDSPKASAALSRRCLQKLLRDEAKVKPGNLSNEIQEVIDSKALQSDLNESIDAIRNIGNFATHPIKSENSGEIIDVEPGEAEWSLDVLESLFDFYFIRPAKLKEKKAALDQKLKDAGKPPMK